MANLFKKLVGSKNKDSSANTAILSEPDLTIARANNEMQLLTQAAIEMWGLDTAASMDDACEFTALACYLGDGQGGYRGVSGSTCVFMVYGPVTLNKKD